MAGDATPKQPVETRGIGSQIPFENLNESGTYISNWTGHLLRVPDEALSRGNSPRIEIRGKEPMFVTKLSDDPYISLSKARIIAADLDQHVNF